MAYTPLKPVSLKHDGTDGTVNTDGTAIEWQTGQLLQSLISKLKLITVFFPQNYTTDTLKPTEKGVY